MNVNKVNEKWQEVLQKGKEFRNKKVLDLYNRSSTNLEMQSEKSHQKILKKLKQSEYY